MDENNLLRKETKVVYVTIPYEIFTLFKSKIHEEGFTTVSRAIRSLIEGYLFSDEEF